MRSADSVSSARGREAATLLQCVVVIACGGILAALCVAAVQRARAAAACAECQHRLRQVAMAVHGYEAQHRKLPEGCAYPFGPGDVRQELGLSWMTAILPFIDQADLWDLAWQAQVGDSIYGNTALHRSIGEHVMPAYLCPTERYQIGHNGANGWQWGVTSYFGVAGTNFWARDGVFHSDLVVHMADITDGTSNTIMVGERPAGPDGTYAAWYKGWGDMASGPMLDAGFGRWAEHGCRSTSTMYRLGELDNVCDSAHFWSLHAGGANFALADGSARFISYECANVLPALATRAGGEVVSLE